MGTSLVGRINGQTFDSLNHFHNRRTITVYVENEDDIPFWNFFFSKRNLPTVIKTATNGKRGKQSVLDFADRLTKEFILCVDSDFDYLHNGKTQQSRLITTNPYIFHTYIHSIESYKCFAEILGNVLVDATFTKNEISFNYVSFLKSYSSIIYNIFLFFMFYEQKYQIEFDNFTIEKQRKTTELSENELNIWINSNKPEHLFPLEEGLNRLIEISPLILNNTQGEKELAKLENLINEKINALPVPDTTSFEQLKNELSNLGLEKQNTYLFIQGHTLFRNVVMQFLKPLYNRIISTSRTQFHSEIRNTSDNKKKENIDNNLRHYEKLLTPIKIALSNHKYFDNCPFAEKIFNDIDLFLDFG